MATCPAGHPSESTDYCDICGAPMAAPTAPAGAAPTGGSTDVGAPPAPKAMGVVCPNCGVMNAPGALFCEACGYDYTTGTMPRPAPALSVLDLDAALPDSSAEGQQPPGTGDSQQVPDQRAAAGTDRRPPAPGDTADAPPVASEGVPVGGLDLDTPTPAARPVPPAAPSGAPVTPPSESESSSFDWVVEIWIDPEWYALQQSPDPMPSPGLPDIMPLRKRSLLIGRPSRSRNIHPDIDCEPDTGISRSQAQLTTDGTRWFIEDLDSANGTYVAEAAGGLPTEPIPSGRRRELGSDERIYLGAWTRLVLRRATPEEQEAYASV